MPITIQLQRHMQAYENENDVRYTIREWAKVLTAWAEEHFPGADAALSVNFLHRMKHGEVDYLSLEKLGLLCEFFGCTPNDLLWSNGQPCTVQSRTVPPQEKGAGD